MRPLALLLGSLLAGSAFAQTSQPSSAPASAPASIPVVVATVAPPIANIQPPTRAEPIPQKKISLPQLNFLLQAWYDSAPSDAAESIFRIRRAEVHVSGEILPKRFRYNIMADFAKSILRNAGVVLDQNGIPDIEADDDSVLQDAWVAYTLPNGADIQLGQYKKPIALEGVTSTERLYLPERSPVSRLFGDERDLGVSIFQRKEGYMYSLGFFDGNSLNELDTDPFKEVGGRVEAYPRDGLLLGAASLFQVFNDGGSQKTRLEFDVKFERELLVIVSELHMATNGEQPSAGGYILGMVPLPFDDRLQFGGRYSLLARDLRAEPGEPLDTLQEFTLGANLYIKDNNAKLQGSISRFINTDETRDFTEIIISGQASF
jgi:hypothetical protein